jgi:hypothetical protein
MLVRPFVGRCGTTVWVIGWPIGPVVNWAIGQAIGWDVGQATGGTICGAVG